jgi:ribosomal protein S18 acetylase RimI-like enzyme
MSDAFATRVRTARADANALDGLVRAHLGGDVARVGGARLMYSGSSARPRNDAQVVSLPVDLAAAERWFAEREALWGLAVPVGLDYAPGEYIFTQRCMGLEPDRFAAAAAPADVHVRIAGLDDLAAFCQLDAEVFGGLAEQTRQWLAPTFESRHWTHWLAQLDDRLVGIASSRRSDLDAGPCGTITGVAVSEPFRRRGIAGALSSRAVAALFDSGATLVHLSPDTDDAASVYARLGFREVSGVKLYAIN